MAPYQGDDVMKEAPHIVGVKATKLKHPEGRRGERSRAHRGTMVERQRVQALSLRVVGGVEDFYASPEIVARSLLSRVSDRYTCATDSPLPARSPQQAFGASSMACTMISSTQSLANTKQRLLSASRRALVWG